MAADCPFAAMATKGEAEDKVERAQEGSDRGASSRKRAASRANTADDVVELSANAKMLWDMKRNTNFVKRIHEHLHYLDLAGRKLKFAKMLLATLTKSSALRQPFGSVTRDMDKRAMYEATFGEVLPLLARIAALKSEKHVYDALFELGVRHIDYAGSRYFAEAFGRVVLGSTKEFFMLEGAAWAKAQHEVAFKWIYDVVVCCIFDMKEMAGPHVGCVRASFQSLLGLYDQRMEVRFGKIMTKDDDDEREAAHKATGESSSKSESDDSTGGHDTSESGSSNQELSTSGTDKDDKSGLANLDALLTPTADKLHVIGTLFLRRYLEPLLLTKHKRSFSFPDTHGKKVAAAIIVVVTNITKYSVLRGRLRELAAFHLSMGIDKLALECFTEAAVTMLKTTLPSDQFGDEHEDGWLWAMNQVNRMFLHELRMYRLREKHLTSSLHQTLAHNGGSLDKAVGSFFDKLFEEHEIFDKSFVKPIAGQAKMFALAVSFLTDTLEIKVGSPFFIRLQKLTTGHIQLCLQEFHFEMFGNVLLAWLKVLMTDAGCWSGSVEKCWTSQYQMVSTAMLNLLIKSASPALLAVLNNNEDDLCLALDSFPRGYRIGRAIETNMCGEMVSLLELSSRRGAVGCSHVMVQDLSTIRADRQATYYGSMKLCRSLPDVWSMLSKFAPEVIDEFLDGMIWVALEPSNTGERECHMYIEGIVGNPELYDDPTKLPLAQLTRHTTQ